MRRVKWRARSGNALSVLARRIEHPRHTEIADYFDGFGDPAWCTMGRWSYGKPTVHVYRGDTARVTIGSFTSIAHDCEVMAGGNHRMDWVTSWPMKEVFGGGTTGETLWSKGDVTIGNDVWLGRGAKILSGSTIGDGAVIAAYSVVTSDIRPYAIVGGNPGREIRRRFDDATIEALQRIKWWDWSDSDLAARWAELCSPDLTAFVDHYDPAIRHGGPPPFGETHAYPRRDRQ